MTWLPNMMGNTLPPRGDASNRHAAMDSAAAGDTVLVAAGQSALPGFSLDPLFCGAEGSGNYLVA